MATEIDEEASSRMAAGQDDFPAMVPETKEKREMPQERLARAATDDNEGFLLRLKERLDRESGRRSFYLLTAADNDEEAPPRMAAGHEDFPAMVPDTKEERKILQERLAIAATDDNESFLLRLKQRFHRVGIELPTIEVRFENLSVAAEAYVGSRSSPSFSNAILNTIQSLGDLFHLMPSKKRRINILEDASGIIKPGRMTLLLGPPGSGKTTFLLALAGKLHSDLKVSGKVRYNGHGMEEFVPQRTAAYVDQRDLHIAEMTVRETLEFSARCQGVGSRYDLLTQLLKREEAENIKPDHDIDLFMKIAAMEGDASGIITEYIMKILKLDGCADNMVGNQMIRGISGGEKKRVTLGEMIVGPIKALFMDEISTGLDTSTTFQIVNSLRQAIHILGGTAVLSLLQPAPETYELFDDIILLSDGHIVYQGSRKHVPQFFESMGFKCPERKGYADFLQEVTSRKDQHKYWVGEHEHRYIPIMEFADAFHNFHEGEKLKKEMSIPFDRSKSHPSALVISEYGIKRIELLKACAWRELILIKRNFIVYAFRAVQVTLMSFITMTLFLRTNLHHRTVIDGQIYMGFLYYSVLIMMLNAFSELALTIVNLPVITKQRDYNFYPAWAYTIPMWLLKIPFSFTETAIWLLLNYFAIGLDPSLERFLKCYIVLVVTNQVSVGLFRIIAAIGRVMAVANAYASFTVGVSVVLGGFLISYDDLQKWWIWAYWSSPLMYSQNAISVNEFLGNTWNQMIPDSNVKLGIEVLNSHGIVPEANRYWIGVGALLAYVLLCNFIFTITLSYAKKTGRDRQVVSEEALREKRICITGKHEDSSFEGNNSARKHENRNKVFDLPHETKGMVLPFIPIVVAFDNISYSIDMPQEMKEMGARDDRLVLLNGVSGSLRPGILTALMGVSGAGKTTLMDVLAGRKTGGYTEGNITINGYPKQQETFTRVLGYCEQNDIHSANITVYESLAFSAWLRLPSEVDAPTRKMFIEEVMELVELSSIRKALVGSPTEEFGLTLEQRKRLTIAVEIVANPSIIFMDEPTSGLDSRAASIVMRTVRNIVDTKRTVLCTIHQPSIDIFEAFDELFLLKRGGKEIYVGPLGSRSFHLIKYLEGIQGVSRIKDEYNPATWMLEESTLTKEQALQIDFSEIYRTSELYQKNKELIKESSEPTPELSALHFQTQYSQAFLTQCAACLWKQHLSYWRNPLYTCMRFFVTIMLALFNGTIFWDFGVKRGKVQDLFDVIGSMYAASIFIGVIYSVMVQPIVVVERTVFYRERSAGMYSAVPFAFAQVLIELPYILVQSLLYSLIVYSMIALHWTMAKFFWYLFFTYLTLLYYTYFGMLAVSLTPNSRIAVIWATIFYGMWNIFCGFLIPQTRIPVWWRWYYWACPVSWTLHGLIGSQYGDDMSSLDTNETVAQFVRSHFGFSNDHLELPAVMVTFFAVLFSAIFALAIKYLNFQRK